MGKVKGTSVEDLERDLAQERQGLQDLEAVRKGIGERLGLARGRRERLLGEWDGKGSPRELQQLDQEIADLEGQDRRLEDASKIRLGKIAALEPEHAAAEAAAKKARAPQVVARELERLAGEKERVRAVLLEAKHTVDVEIVPAVAAAQRLYGECYNGDTESKMEHGLQDLRGAIAQGLWHLEGRAR